jgi:uncharacterized protein (TIGR03435 family)
VLPVLDDLRPDPRFAELRCRIGLSWATMASLGIPKRSIVTLESLMRTHAPLVALGITLGGLCASAQTPASSSGPRFEVVSVKPNRSGDPHGTAAVQPGGRYAAVNITVSQLISEAYGLQSGQLVGGPDWTRIERVDITATAGGDLQGGAGSGSSRLQLMLQALLTERFRLVVHRESREQPIYALVLARSDRTLGPKMRASTAACAGPSGPPIFNAPVTCAARLGHGRLSAADATLAQLATSLSSTVQRVVRDRTGLMGRYSMEVAFTPERMPQASGTNAGATSPVSIDPNGTSIFTALQEELGLKLESARGPVDIVVIDSIERASAD